MSPTLGKRLLIIGVVSLSACHRTTEVRGIYVNQDTTGTLFPCTAANTAVLVSDRKLAMRYFAVLKPGEAAYVDLRGVNAKSGTIYKGQRYFLVQEIIELRPRAEGECPAVAHSAGSVLK